MFVWRRTSKNKATSAKKKECMDEFDTFYTIYVLIVFVYTACRIKFSCQAMRRETTRRELKNSTRMTVLTFSILFLAVFAWLMYSSEVESDKEKC